MDGILSAFVSLPGFLQTVVLAVLGGGLGALAGFGIAKIFRLDPLIILLSAIIGVGLALQVPTWKPRGLATDTRVDQMVARAKEQRLFSIIFTAHPEAEAEFRRGLAAILETIPRNNEDERFRQAQALSSELISRHVKTYMTLSPVFPLNAVIERNAAVLQAHRHQPELCVNYYLNRAQFKENDLTPATIAEDMRVKADMVEAAIRQPTPQTDIATLQTIIDTLIQRYRDLGYAPENMRKVGQVGTLPAEEACTVATEFSVVLASFEPEESVRLFKSLLIAGNKPPELRQ